MKKTFPVNINGAVYYIDEDAYNLLNNYIDQLRKAFPGKEGAETINDIESRISEIFAEKLSKGKNIIVIDDVNEIIKQMGSPKDLAGDNTDDTDTTANNGQTTPPPLNAQPQTIKRLYRDESNKVFGGVFAGLQHYLGWSANIMRFFYVVLALFTYFWPLLIIYFVAWMIIPAARSPRQILEMTGTPITVSNVGQTILGTPDPTNTPAPASNVFTDVFSVLGKVFLAIFGVVGAAIGIGAIIGFVVMLCSVIMMWGWHDLFIQQNIFGIANSFYNPWIGTIGGICLSVAIFLPAAAAVWAGCNALFNVKAPSKGAIITLVIIEIIMIVASVVLLQLASTDHLFAFASTAATTSMTCIS